MLNLPVVLLYLVIGCGEWWLALRRTLACARGELVTLVSLVFIENILGLFVLSMFIKDNNWGVAIAYSIGGSLGALIIAWREKKKK
jgi:hypothetical protein